MTDASRTPRSSFGPLLSVLSVLSVVPSAPAAEPTYWQDVRPLLRKHCTVCHNPRNLAEKDLSGGLTLDTYGAALRWKEKNRDLVTPGKSGDSALYKVVISDDDEKRMPLGAKRLDGEEIALLKRWIDGGAKEGKKPAETPVTPVKPARARKLDVTLPTASGRALALRVGPLSPVVALAYHPDGKLLASGSYGLVTIWDVTAAKPVRVLTNVLGAVNDLRFSPDGKLLAVAGGQPSARGDLRLFSTAGWKLEAVLAGHDDVINSVAFDKQGKRLASASYDRTVRVWDVAGRKTLQKLTMHSDFVLSVAFSPDGKHVYSGSKDRSVRMTEADTGKGVFTFSDRSEDVLAVAAHPDGKSVVATGVEPGLSWWNPRTGEKVRSVGGHRGAVHELAFSRDGKRLASAGSDGTVKLFNTSTGAVERSIAAGSLVYAVALSADGKRVAAGSFDGLVRVFDAGNGEALGTLLSLPPAGERHDWLALAPAGYAAGSDGLVGQGRWGMAGKPLDAAAVWKVLRKPGLAAKALRGEAVAVPAFGK